MSLPPTTQVPLSLTLSADDLRTIVQAAEQTHQTESEFVLRAALQKAEHYVPRVESSQQELMTLVQKLQEDVRRANPTNRDLLQEFLDERRAEAERE